MNYETDWELEIVQKPQRWGWYPENVEPPPMPAFTVLKSRWVVEHTFAWVMSKPHIVKTLRVFGDEQREND